MNNSNALWYPYAPLASMSPPLSVRKAQGAVLYLANGQELIDGISSWWCTLHGYNHPELNQSLSTQLDQFAHVMMGGLNHEPAEKLANTLCQIYPGMKSCFFGDSGSVGVEIALKMACQYWSNIGLKGKSKFVSLSGGYHGDTAGAMSVGEPDDEMHAAFHGILPVQFFTTRPNGWPAENLDECILHLEAILEEHHTEIAAFICEPLMQGYGGFKIYDPNYLKAARILCDKYNVLMIFDEVATGFGRTGKLFACEMVGVLPDITILGKALTAGYLGMSATLANERVFSAYWSADPQKAFMHGPTFMGNALACAVALKSLDIFFEEDRLSDVRRIEALFHKNWTGFQHEQIKEIRILGAMMVIECTSSDTWKGLREFATQRGAWIRPFRNFIYLMPPFIISDSQLIHLSDVLKQWFQQISNSSNLS